MVIQIEIFSAQQEQYLKQAYDVRKHVFIDEQQLDKYLEFDGLDEHAVHFLVLVDNQPAANLRYVEKPDFIQIDKLAVLPQYRQFGIFNVLIRYALRELDLAKKDLKLDAVIHLVGYYKRLGFVPVGDPFKTNKMQYQTMLMKKNN